MQEYEFDVALSFAGEDRQYAEEFVKLLDDAGYSFFYDDDMRGQLWGENLYNYLYAVYKEKARYCIIFTSEHYERKLWTNHELKSAQARAFSEKDEVYILPIRLDDTEVSGIPPTVGYLDVRLMSIDEIYELLVEKLTGERSSRKTSSSIPSVAEEVPCEFVLLRSEEELHFVPLQEVRRDSEEISFKLLPESSEEVVFLSTLQSKLSSTFASRISLSCAYREYAAWVNPKEIVETQSHWEVILNRDDRWQNSGFFADMTVNGIPTDQIAEMRARRILLNQSLSDANPALRSDQSNLESHVGGMPPSSQHERKLQVTVSPLLNLYHQFKETPGTFKKCARLVSILYLKLTNTVDNILDLDLELLDQEQLQVKFKGIRPKIYSNVDPSTIEFEGICPLSD